MLDLKKVYIRALRDITEEIRILELDLDELKKERNKLIQLVDDNERIINGKPMDKYMEDFRRIKFMSGIKITEFEEDGGKKKK